MMQLIDRIRAVANEALDAEQTHAWLVLDQLADAIETGHADVMAKSLALAAPEQEKAALDELQDVVYTNGHRSSPATNYAQDWLLEVGDLQGWVTIYSPDGSHTTLMITGNKGPKTFLVHVWIRKGKPVLWLNGNIGAVREFLRAFRAQQATALQVA